MKLTFSPLNAALVAILVLFGILAAYLLFSTQPNPYPPDVFVCNEQVVPFRVGASACLSVTIAPTSDELLQTLSHPLIEYVYILVNPNGTAEEALAAFEIYKTLQGLQLPVGVVYTEPWPDQPTVPVLSIKNATNSRPIIQLLPNQSETRVVVNGPQIQVYAQNQDDLDAAACKIAMLSIQTQFSCFVSQ